LKEEHRLRVFENMMLRRIFRSKRNDVRGEWRRLLNKEVYTLCSSPNIIRMIRSKRLRREGHVARMRERRGACRDLVGKSERKRPPGRPRRRWENNFKINIQEVVWWA
jgi:hypothetical protein